MVLAAAALSAVVWAGTSHTGAAQTPASPPPRPLTDAQVTKFLTTPKDLGTIDGNEPASSTQAKQEVIAGKEGSANGDEFVQVGARIGAVQYGIGGGAGQYVGLER
ncbi:hypothetical protein R1A27_32680 (plasmid) [Methylobacterium sp. NMS12]|uniref:hypothetical protein n=1 Tax=Methylobacterium sp. NMS12 TaxID=3079766 RepID=UPI003F884397